MEITKNGRYMRRNSLSTILLNAVKISVNKPWAWIHEDKRH